MNTELPLPASPSLPLSGEAVSTSSPRTANRLTLSQTFALGAWIKDHEQQAKDDPDTQCAQHAALDLSFPVTAANFTAARQALGIDKTKPTTPPTLEERITEQEGQTKALFQQSILDHTRVTTMRSDLDAKIAELEQTLANHRAGFENLLKRLQTAETAIEVLTARHVTDNSWNRQKWEDLRDLYKEQGLRINALEQRFHPESQPMPNHPGRMETEVTYVSDTECPTPTAEQV